MILETLNILKRGTPTIKEENNGITSQEL